MENCLDEIGGNRFSGTILNQAILSEYNAGELLEVTGAGPVNFSYKHDNARCKAGRTGTLCSNTRNYRSERTGKRKIANPTRKGDMARKHRPADNSIYRAFQVVKPNCHQALKFRRIEVKGKPLAGQV